GARRTDAGGRNGLRRQSRRPRGRCPSLPRRPRLPAGLKAAASRFDQEDKLTAAANSLRTKRVQLLPDPHRAAPFGPIVAPIDLDKDYSERCRRSGLSNQETNWTVTEFCPPTDRSVPLAGLCFGGLYHLSLRGHRVVRRWCQTLQADLANYLEVRV